jgi:hypothetical protein
VKEEREIVSEIVVVRRNSGEERFAVLLEDSLGFGDEDFREYLVSNTMWGVSGSLPDQLLFSNGKELNEEKKKELRSDFRKLIIKLGTLQMKKNMTNPRTEMWVSAYTNWERSGL